MRPGIAAGAALVAAAAGAALGVQLSLLFSSLGGTAQSPWGEIAVATATCITAAVFIGGLSTLFALGAGRRLLAFAQGRGMFRLARDLPPIAGVTVAIGLLAGPTLLSEGAVRTPPPRAVSPPHEYDARLAQLEANLLRALRERTPDADPEAAPEAVESACSVEVRGVLARRTAWMRANLAHALDCADPGQPALRFDDAPAGAVIVDEARMCDPMAPFSLQVRSDSYVLCQVLPSVDSRKVLESLRARLGRLLAQSVEFVGHTDGTPVRAGGCTADDKTLVADNWHLSALRAVRAREAFAAAAPPVVGPVGGVDVVFGRGRAADSPAGSIQIVASAVGVADEVPAPELSDEPEEDRRARNRRVSIVITGASSLNVDLSKCVIP